MVYKKCTVIKDTVTHKKNCKLLNQLKKSLLGSIHLTTLLVRVDALLGKITCL